MKLKSNKHKKKWMKYIVILAGLVTLFMGVILPLAYDVQVFYLHICPASIIERSTWQSITVWYCVGDGPIVTKKCKIISESVLLNEIRQSFTITTWDIRELHTSDKYNRVNIVLCGGSSEMLVLHKDNACYYDWRKRAIGITIPGFAQKLIEILQQEEDMPVHLWYSNFFPVRNQDRSIDPAWNKWRYGGYARPSDHLDIKVP
jgi:hypothetical protein